jgi:antitoxin component of MazEF toxin-antitoxin module
LPAKIQRKVLRSGDSKVAALPPDWLRMFKIEQGDNIDLIYNSIVIIKPQGFELDPDFLRKEFNLILKLEEREAKPQQWTTTP